MKADNMTNQTREWIRKPMEWRQSKKVATVGIIVSCCGLLLVGFVAWQLVMQYLFVKNALRATGTFVGYHYSDVSREARASDSESSFAGRVNTSSASPKISYITAKGERVTFVNSASLSPDLDLNELEVFYSAEDPQNAIVNDFFGVWGWLYVLGGLGLAVLIAGVSLWKFLSYSWEFK